MGLDGRAKSVNGPRKRGSGVEEQEQVEMFRCQRRSRGGKDRGGLDLASVGCHHQRGRATGGLALEVATEERGVWLGLP
jgi:hypothetical protein